MSLIYITRRSLEHQNSKCTFDYYELLNSRFALEHRYGESTSSGKALSAKNLERNISVLRSLLLLQARREGNDEEKTLLKDEPEMVKLYDAYATAMREVDRIRTDAETELETTKREMEKFKKETEVLREEKKKIKEENQKLLNNQNVSVTSSAPPAPASPPLPASPP